jgi:hypothetical protein
MPSDARTPWRASQISWQMTGDLAVHSELAQAFTRALIQMIDYDGGVIAEPFSHPGPGQHPATGVLR